MAAETLKLDATDFLELDTTTDQLLLEEDVAAGGRIMSSLAAAGGLAGPGGLAGEGGGLAG